MPWGLQPGSTHVGGGGQLFIRTLNSVQIIYNVILVLRIEIVTFEFRLTSYIILLLITFRLYRPEGSVAK